MKTTRDSDLAVAKAASTFAALGSEQRLAVLRVLVRAGPSGLSIGDLGKRSGVTGSTLPHHMKILSSAGLVNQTRDGRRIICIGADYETMRGLSDYLLSECCADSPEPHQEHGHD